MKFVSFLLCYLNGKMLKTGIQIFNHFVQEPFWRNHGWRNWSRTASSHPPFCAQTTTAICATRTWFATNAKIWSKRPNSPPMTFDNNIMIWAHFLNKFACKMPSLIHLTDETSNWTWIAWAIQCNRYRNCCWENFISCLRKILRKNGQ